MEEEDEFKPKNQKEMNKQIKRGLEEEDYPIC